MSLLCTWEPGPRYMGDIIVDEESVFSDRVYGPVVSMFDSNERVYMDDESRQGRSSLIIKEVTKSDSRKFACAVSRVGKSNPIILEVVEPPVPEPTRQNLMEEQTEEVVETEPSDENDYTSAGQDFTVAQTENAAVTEAPTNSSADGEQTEGGSTDENEDVNDMVIEIKIGEVHLKFNVGNLKELLNF